MTSPAPNATLFSLRGAIGALAALLLPALLLLDTLLAHERGWHPPSPAATAIAVASAALAVLVLTTLATARGRSFWERRWAPPVALVLFGLVPALAAEALLQSRDARRVREGFHHKAPHMHAVFHPDPAVMPGISPEAVFTTNSLGIRGPEHPPRAAALRILCIGGSTTECLYLDDTKTWPRLVAERLAALHPEHPVWVGDVGTSGYTSAEHARFLAESPLAREADVFFVLVGINDFIRALGGEPFPRGILEHPRPLWTRSLLLAPALERLGIPRVEPPLPLAIEDDRGQAYVARRKLRHGSPVCHELPDLAPRLDEYEARLRRLVADARALGARIVLATQPALYEPDLPPRLRDELWLGRMRDARFLDVPLLRRGLDAFNARLEQTARALDVPVVDLRPLDGREDCFYDDCHFTENGAREVARRVADALAPFGK